MNEVLNFFLSIARTPSILVGLVAVLGLILQKKDSTEVISGVNRGIWGNYRFFNSIRQNVYARLSCSRRCSE